jgi:hypothetical protein
MWVAVWVPRGRASPLNWSGGNTENPELCPVDRHDVEDDALPPGRDRRDQARAKARRIRLIKNADVILPDALRKGAATEARH